MPVDPRASWRADMVVLTCEHAGRDVPPKYTHLFADAEPALASHRGFDPGAAEAARRMAERLGAPLVISTTTRLLVELNRSVGHAQLFSEFTRDLPEPDRRAILERHYTPFRAEVRRIIDDVVAAGRRVLHVSVHSFADVLDGSPRDLDIGILFDPARESEMDVADALRDALCAEAPGTRVAFNRPYLGVDDGHTTALRRAFPSAHYAGIEIELRQGHVHTREAAEAAGELLAGTLAALVAPPGAISSGETASD